MIIRAISSEFSAYNAVSLTSDKVGGRGETGGEMVDSAGSSGSDGVELMILTGSMNFVMGRFLGGAIWIIFG